MANLKNNIKHYMEREKIHNFTDLLIRIYHQLDLQETQYEFVKKEKGNFSKMIKGERQIKYEFIVPLEKILGVSLARLMDEESYKLPVDRTNKPIVKGFRYYAYMNDYSLCKKELDSFLGERSKSILETCDEFGKTLLDYVVEYGSINVIYYLRDRYQIKLDLWTHQFRSTLNESYSMWEHNPVEMARLVASSCDAQLFKDIYDPYFQFSLHGGFFVQSPWVNEDFIEILFDHNNLYESLFEESKYHFEYSRCAKKRFGIESMDYTSINPLVYSALDFALNHLDRYRDKAIQILEFGIKHNRNIVQNLKVDTRGLSLDEIGGLRNYKTNEVLDIFVITKKKDIEDKQINKLIDELLIPIKSIGLEYYL